MIKHEGGVIINGEHLAQANVEGWNKDLRGSYFYLEQVGGSDQPYEYWW